MLNKGSINSCVGEECGRCEGIVRGGVLIEMGMGWMREERVLGLRHC